MILFDTDVAVDILRTRGDAPAHLKLPQHPE